MVIVMNSNKLIHDHGDHNYHTHDLSDVNNSEVPVQQHSHEHTHTQTKIVINRLSRACGHLEAVKRMVEEGRDCSEVLIQLSAVRAALNSTAKIILKDHMDHCIVDAVESGDKEVLEKLNEAIDMLMKS